MSLCLPMDLSRQSIGRISVSPWTIHGSCLWPFFFQLIQPKIHLGGGLWLSAHNPYSRSAKVSEASKVKRSTNRPFRGLGKQGCARHREFKAKICWIYYFYCIIPIKSDIDKVKCARSAYLPHIFFPVYSHVHFIDSPLGNGPSGYQQAHS